MGKKNLFAKFLTNKTTVTLVGIVLGLGVLVGFYMHRVNKQVNPIKIPVAKRALSATQEITKDDIEYIKVSKSFIKKRGTLCPSFFLLFNSFYFVVLAFFSWNLSIRLSIAQRNPKVKATPFLPPPLNIACPKPVNLSPQFF